MECGIFKVLLSIIGIEKIETTELYASNWLRIFTCIYSHGSRQNSVEFMSEIVNFFADNPCMGGSNKRM